jgi:membrane associated rhomboid family serine protease
MPEGDDYSLTMENQLITAEEPDDWRRLDPASIENRFSQRNDESLMRRWALVLTARFIPCRIEHEQSDWQLLLPADLLLKAVDELRIFEEKNRNWPPATPPYRPVTDNSLATLSVLFLLATFHNITRLNSSFFDHTPPDWLYLGSAKVHLIHYGEWWRLITALTLHADWLHLFSNLTIGGFFVLLLCREYGSGLGWTLLLVAGALGNWANAQVQLPTHSSIGASTAVFAAVGALTAINLVRHRLDRRGQWKLIVVGALALLALLGTEGKNTDLGAHLFGFLFGVGLGIFAELQVARRGSPGSILNRILALLSGLLVTGAWAAAFFSAG